MKKVLVLLSLIILVSACTKPEIKVETQVLTYPNPVTTLVIVAVKNEQREPCLIRIIGPDGKQVAEFQSEAGAPTDGIRFDLEGKSRGTYQVVVEFRGRVFTDKFYKV